jgi:hypothetical protein
MEVDEHFDEEKATLIYTIVHLLVIYFHVVILTFVNYATQRRNC